MNIDITKLKPSEWHLYKAIRIETLTTDQIAFTITLEDTLAYTDQFWKEKIEDPFRIYFVAKDGEKVVGCMYLILKIEEEPTTAGVGGVYVSRDYRKMGIAEKLFDTIFEEAKKHKHVDQLRLWVNETQLPARHLYEKMGFNYAEVHEKEINYQGNLYDKLYMRRKLYL